MLTKGVTLRGLEVFEALARTGSVAQASDLTCRGLDNGCGDGLSAKWQPRGKKRRGASHNDGAAIGAGSVSGRRRHRHSLL